MKSALLFAVVLLSSAAISSGSETHSPQAHAEEPAVRVTLGESVVALTGPWKFHVGDDPQWADPGYDDSQWEIVDLTPTASTTVAGVPIPGFVSRWTSRGHAGHAGYAWYRIKVQISGATGPLSLLSPPEFDDAFQVFANGRLVGSFGNFNHPVPELYYSNPAIFSLDPTDRSSGEYQTTTLAFRFYMAPDGLLRNGTGGMHGSPRIGLPRAISPIWHMEWQRLYLRSASSIGMALLFGAFALLIAIIFAFNRAEKILLLPLCACLLYVVRGLLIFSTTWDRMSELHMEMLIHLVTRAGWGMWLLTWWAYFNLQRYRWLLKLIVGVTVFILVLSEFQEIALLGWGSHRLLPLFRVGDFAIGIARFGTIIAIGWLGWRNRERDRLLLLIALFFYMLVAFQPLLGAMNLRTSWHPFGVLIPLELLASCGQLVCFSFVLFRQFRNSLLRQKSIEEDMKQAQEIQRLLVPEQLPRLRRWRIESEYRPARQVGGDFFQIIPSPIDESILIVAGDVAGKGLQAGMLVALLVGAIRTESEHTFDPIDILKALNSRLLGRNEAQATCLALRINEDGAALLANAGHLPPYLNGVEVSMEGALPLGTIDECEFPVTEFHLQPGDRLVLLSDGIVEAQNERGDLFGFDRVRIMLAEEISTAGMARAAQDFGQEDDISVLSIIRNPAMLEATV